MVTGPSKGTRAARKARKREQRHMVAGPSQETKTAPKARGRLRVEQDQNLRWLRAQPGISTTTQGELERYFMDSITDQESIQSATQSLSDEGQALVQRLQDERREALSRKTKPGTMKDWFKKGRTHKQQPKPELRNDLAELMDRTIFFKKAAKKQRHRDKVQKRLENKLKRSEAGKGAEKAGGAVVGRDAVEHTESLAHIVHGVDEMCLGE